MPRIPRDDVIRALASDGPDHARRESVASPFDIARRRMRFGFPEVTVLHLEAAVERRRELHPIAREQLAELSR